MKNLIIVFTPLQFLNAIHYIKGHNEPFELVVLTDSKINIEQIKKIDNENRAIFPLAKLLFFGSNLLWLIKMIYVRFISVKKYAQVLIGNYNNIAGYYAGIRFFESGKDVVLLDDGLATFNIYTNRNVHNVLNNERLFGGKGVALYKWIFRINKSRIIHNLKFYTLYNLINIAPPKKDLVYNFSYSGNSTKHDENLVWFIGSPLVALNIIDKEVFIKIINTVKHDCIRKGKKLIYILHRFEEPIEEVDVVYLKFKKPLEDVFLNQYNKLPSTIISFYSTALLNICSFVPNIKGYYIDVTNYKYNSKGNLKEVYDFFNSVPGLKEYKIINKP